MIERVQNVQNPLTIIAIFAGLAEVASSTVMAIVDNDVQVILVWFVAFFPVFLALLFFLTLNFNSQVLYAPSDFQNEDNFLDLLRNKKTLEASFGRLNEALEGTTAKIIASISAGLGQESQTRSADLRKFIESDIKELKSSVKDAEESVNLVSLRALPRSEFQARIVAYLFAEKGPVPLSAISTAIGMNEGAVGRAVSKLVSRDVLAVSTIDDEKCYGIASDA